MSPTEALEVGLVDKLTELNETLSAAETKIQQYLSFPTAAFMQTKKALKQELLGQMKLNFEENLDILHKQLMSEESREIMGKVVDFLNAKKN